MNRLPSEEFGLGLGGTFRSRPQTELGWLCSPIFLLAPYTTLEPVRGLRLIGCSPYFCVWLKHEIVTFERIKSFVEQYARMILIFIFVHDLSNFYIPYQKLTLKETYVFFKNDLKEPREVTLLGKATLHMKS